MLVLLKQHDFLISKCFLYVFERFNDFLSFLFTKHTIHNKVAINTFFVEHTVLEKSRLKKFSNTVFWPHCILRGKTLFPLLTLPPLLKETYMTRYIDDRINPNLNSLKTVKADILIITLPLRTIFLLIRTFFISHFPLFTQWLDTCTSVSCWF